jgi:hypothetical protein
MKQFSGKQFSGLNIRMSWVAVVCWVGLAFSACAADDPATPEVGATRQQLLSAPPYDTLCGDGVCSGSETLANCPDDCTNPPVCGDGLCNGSETPASCPADCSGSSVCGDGTCDPGETAANCAVDCVPAACGDCVCSYGETAACPWDCDVPGYPSWCIQQ